MAETIYLRDQPIVQYGILLRIGTMFAVAATLAWLGIKFAYGHAILTTIWTPDAVVLAVLLRVPRRQWWVYLLTGFLACTTVDFIFVRQLQASAIIAALSSLTIVVAALLLAGYGQRIDLTRRADLVKFGLAAGLCGPAISATVVTIYSFFYYHTASAQAWMNWFLQHALGFLIVTPPLLMFKALDLRRAFGPEERWALLTSLLIVMATTTVVFWQTSYPLLFMIFPALTFATFRGGFVGSSFAILLTAVIAIGMTLARHGPFMLIDGEYGLQILILQVFLVVAFLSSMPIAVAITEVRKFQQEMIAARQDLAEQNRLLQLAEQTANVGHWRLDLATSNMFWSDEVYRIHGVEKSTYRLTPETVIAQYHPGDRDKIFEAGESAINKRDTTNIILRAIRPDGEIRYVRSLTRCEFDVHGNPRMLFGVSHDITDIKRTEHALIDALDEAQRASRAKSDFLASMSHELRTPLNAIIGFSELLMKHPNEHLSEQQTEYLGYVLRGGNHLLELIKDILDLSTIEAGQLRISIERVDLTGLLTELESTLTPIALRKGLTIDPLILPELPLPVLADRGRLLQVLLNLGSNAIKYNKPNGSLSILVGRMPNGYIRISVKDTGKGIPADRQGELFQPFNRLGFENSAIEGTGIGLSICERLMALMGGNIGFTSEVGIGSNFWIEVKQATRGAISTD